MRGGRRRRWRGVGHFLGFLACGFGLWDGEGGVLVGVSRIKLRLGGMVGVADEKG